MVDRYTKVVLSVIALALSALAIEQAAPAARAQGVAGASCGDSDHPCWVKFQEPVEVLNAAE